MNECHACPRAFVSVFSRGCFAVAADAEVRMEGSRIMKSTIVAVVIAMGIVAMPVGASSVKTASSSAHSAVGAAVAVAPATGSTTTYALNKMRNVPVAGTAAGGKVF